MEGMLWIFSPENGFGRVQTRDLGYEASMLTTRPLKPLFEDVIVSEDNVEDKDDSDWVESTDNDSVMSDEGESDE
jgi:hypothetical protein